MLGGTVVVGWVVGCVVVGVVGEVVVDGVGVVAGPDADGLGETVGEPLADGVLAVKDDSSVDTGSFYHH
ncbi:hypothetical protein E1292_00785 [Nonomuraea deserti]|uniref:Uncharacterized protein n=1 Tax=Nonomuraea deserti TaxID=1848322 RepID=A0A4R4WBY2_9ACTN|nr:hypothetical protein [Nonomuraea deserti]TDD12825.1 hypothetical protein E1292_00785 [Nonomuraea deserti]